MSQLTRELERTELRRPSFFLWAYQILFALVGVGYLLMRLLRREPLPGIRQRLAWYPRELRFRLKGLRQPIWIHLVSVGEVLAAQPLIEELRRELPRQDWVITTVTPTGQEVARQLIRGLKDQLLYLPWDVGPVVAKAIQAIRPALFITFETELWPTLFHHLGAQGVPIVVVNGRISPAAYRRYLWVRFLMERALSPVTLLLTQSPQDARRFAAIGASKDRLMVTGNLKWDLKILQENGHSASPSFRDLLGLSPSQILWTAGSTHPGEERLILEIYQRLKPKYPTLELLIAPRHPQRIPEVEQEVAKAGYTTTLRSRLEKKAPKESDAVFLLDTLGELTKVYQASDLVFVGGSLVPHGGHNLVEPAAFRRPILTGPYLHNFQSVADSLVQAGGMIVVKSAEELEEAVRRLLENPATRQELGRRAHAVIQEHRGATSRTAELILRRFRDRLEKSDSVRSPQKGLSPLVVGLLSFGAILYRLGLNGIHLLYRTKVRRVHRLSVPVVSVGNLTWGGTGKTPLVLQLARRLKERGRLPAVLTRGYGQDEARLLTERLHPIPVLVGPDRVATGKRAIRDFGADLLLLDDGYQQWRLKKDLEILAIDATAPFGNGHLIPRGSLREPVHAASKADLIVVTKADQNPEGLKAVEGELRRLNSRAPIFFARYQPVKLTCWPSGEELPLRELKGKPLCTLAGIARPEAFEATVRAHGGKVAMKIRVKDHHPYTTGELLRIFSRCQRYGIQRIVTTTKDAIRIPKLFLETVGPDLKGMELLILEVELEFEPDEGELLHRIDSLLAR